NIHSVICTNRDEFLNRPTSNAHFHSFEDVSSPNPDGTVGPILSGRDLQAGGSWFGLNRSGRVALLTNITEPLAKYNTSRGSLVSSFLLSTSSHPLEDEIGKIVPEDANYAGFNLLLLAPTLSSPSPSPSPSSSSSQPQIEYRSLFVTNHGGGGPLTARSLLPSERTCGGISNGIDGAGAERWPKVQHATEAFAEVVAPAKSSAHATTEAELVERLFDLLSWHPPTPITARTELKTTIHVPPVPIVLEVKGSPSTTPAYYGTRLSTVLLISKTGDVTFIERDIWQLVDGAPKRAGKDSERVFKFKLDLALT
ncbi:hypothetical protein BDN70DRAFT_803997, partial [Pholiota conissans]